MTDDQIHRLLMRVEKIVRRVVHEELVAREVHKVVLSEKLRAKRRSESKARAQGGVARAIRR